MTLGKVNRLLGTAGILTLLLIAIVMSLNNNTIRAQSTEDFSIDNVDNTGDYLTAPGDLPKFTVIKNPGEPLADGYIFVGMYNAKRSRDRASYNLILDDNGEPIYYEKLPAKAFSSDLKKQSNGLVTFSRFWLAEKGKHHAGMNEQYEIVEEYRAGADINDPNKQYNLDIHDFQILENGNALLLANDFRKVDMSQIVPEGSTEASVTGCIIQEVDANDKVVFQWSSWDHLDEIEITDTFIPLDQDSIRYMHCNSIEEDFDKNILLSARNLNEIIKINRLSGDIIWRMGGKKNEFAFVDNETFSTQHDVRRLPNGNITVYDNAKADEQDFARGIEYRVDEVKKEVVMVAEFRSEVEQNGRFRGNMQRLPNGNTFIGWGYPGRPVLAEFGKNGQKLLEFNIDEPLLATYRAFRFPWEGYPTWPPALEAWLEGNSAHLHFSWNGSTETKSYKIFGGRNRDNLQLLATVPRDGFETVYTHVLPEGTDGFWYFKVIPVSKTNQDGPESDIAYVVPGGDNAYVPMVTINR